MIAQGVTQLILMRHGESEANRDGQIAGDRDAPLTARGQRQAEEAARAIAVARVDAIYTSDLRRALETASTLGRLTRVEPVVTSALRERCLGDFSGLSERSLAAQHPGFHASLVNTSLDTRPPQGESRRDCTRRAAALLRGILEERAGQRIVLVSHRILLDHLMRELLGMSDERSPCALIDTDNGGLHWLDGREGRLYLRKLNDTAHLAGLE